jgi:uncharacterized protein
MKVVSWRLFALLLFCGPLLAEVVSPDPALELADLIGGKTQYTQLSHQVLGDMIRKQPAMARYQGVVQRWAREYLTWGRMRAELAQTYHSHFTGAEIRDMVLFFRTPSGQKYVRYTPLLREEMVRIGQRLAREQQPRLIQMLRDAGAKVEVQQATRPPVANQ